MNQQPARVEGVQRKVFIVDNDVTGVRYTTYWSDFVPKEIKSWGYDVEVIKGHPNPNWKYGYHNNFLSVASLYNNAGQLIINRHVPDDAIFIFPNARHPLVLALTEYKCLYKKNWKFLGFWDDGIYYTYLNFKSNMYYGKYKGYYDWSLKFEKFLSACYDINLINNEHQLAHFKRFLNNAKANIQICPNPFSYLYEYAKKQITEKSDLIVCITRPSSQHDINLFVNLRKIYPEYDFVLCYEKNWSIIEHYRLLSKAKIVISHSAKEANPFPIWEALMFGCIPLIPDTNINKLFFGNTYTFPRKILIPPFLNYIKARHFMHDKIKGYMENYLDYSEQIPILCKDVHDKYYSSEGLKQILCKI